MTVVGGRAAKRKGSKAEAEVAAILHDLLGFDVRRTLAGHADDLGDLVGLPGTVLQVKNYSDTGRAFREGLAELRAQHDRAGTPYAAAFIRRPGGRYAVLMEPDQFAALYRDATANDPDGRP